MSFLDTMREILAADGLLKHDTQKARPLSSTEPLAAPPSPCQLCGADSWWRSGPAEAWQCRTCHPPASLPVYEVLGPYGKLDDGVKAQPRADGAAWLAAWREVAHLINGVTTSNPQFEAVMAARERCNVAFERGSWSTFRQAVEQVRLALRTEHER